MTTLHAWSLPPALGRAGRANAPLLMSAFSTRLIVRHAVFSPTCHSMARWYCVRYSRQNCKVSKSWSSRFKSGGRPRFFLTVSRPTSTASMASKVSGLTPSNRRKSGADRARTCSIW